MLPSGLVMDFATRYRPSARLASDSSSSTDRPNGTRRAFSVPIRRWLYEGALVAGRFIEQFQCGTRKFPLQRLVNTIQVAALRTQEKEDTHGHAQCVCDIGHGGKRRVTLIVFQHGQVGDRALSL